MTDELSERELDEQDGRPLPDREAMSVLTPAGDAELLGDDIVFPVEPDIGDPELP